MSDQTDTLISLLTPFGLTQEECQIYLYLLRKSPSSALEISRNLHLARTKVYRLLDKLIEHQLATQQLSERGLKFTAAHPQKIAQLLDAKKHQLEALSSSTPQIVSQLENLLRSSSPHSKVLYYEGIEGLEQVSYNITKAEKLLRVFEMEHLSDFLTKEFSEDVRRKLVENKVTTYDLTNKKSFPAFTEVTEMIEKYSEYRYIDPAKLKINFETLIYNNVYCTYTYKEDKIFIVEIYNDHLAQMQKQIFDFIWSQATPLKFLDNRGKAKVTDIL